MSTKKILVELEKIKDVTVEYNLNLKKYSTMHLDSVGDLVTIRTKNALSEVLKNLNEFKVSYRVLGSGANILLPTTSNSPYLKIQFDYDREIFSTVQTEYVLPASVNLATLTSHANKFGLKGWEVFTGIPATIGGAVFMNAGTNLGEFGQIVKDVKVMNSKGLEKIVTINENSFSYRKNNFLENGDVIFEVTLIHNGVDLSISKKIKEYLELRNRTQPLKEWTCGCVFKNYKNQTSGVTCVAGKFIDIIGLKGLSFKDLNISEKHGNFIENHGSANYEDSMSFIKAIQKELKLQTGVAFNIEVEF